MAMATSASPVAMVPVHAVCRTVSPRLPMGNALRLGTTGHGENHSKREWPASDPGWEWAPALDL